MAAAQALRKLPTGLSQAIGVPQKKVGTNPWLIVGLVVAGVLFLIVLTFVLVAIFSPSDEPVPEPAPDTAPDTAPPPPPPQILYEKHPGKNFVYGKVAAGKDSSDGTVKYLGVYNSIDECTGAHPDGYNAYTWVHDDPSKGSYAAQCYGVIGDDYPRADSKLITSAVRK